MSKRILLIQTSFIGDVILSTALVESINDAMPNFQIDFLLRKGNEGILKNNPKIEEVLIWDKTKDKYANLFNLIKLVRKKKYDVVINLQRFGATGLITALSSTREKWGFSKNPFSFTYTRSIKHDIGNGIHETERNLGLIDHLPGVKLKPPAMYPAVEDFKKVAPYQDKEYVCVAPTSVWFTKQLPLEKWNELINQFPKDINIFLLGANSDNDACEKLVNSNKGLSILNLAGKLNLLQSAALMKSARMNYVNDSAPMHLASAVNANTTVYFCSTIPEFGFGPLSDNASIIQTDESLSCRPCGLHGKSSCPEGHFKCALTIKMKAESLE